LPNSGSLSTTSREDARNDGGKSNKREACDHEGVHVALERARVEVWSFAVANLLHLLSSEQHEHQREDEEDECAADSTCVGHHHLRIVLKTYNYQDWQSKDDGP